MAPTEPACAITRAPMTPAERAKFSGQASRQSLFVNVGCAVIFGVAAIVVLWWCLGWLGALIGPKWARLGHIVGACAGIFALLVAVSGVGKIAQRDRVRLKADLDKGEVEILDVRTSRVCTLEAEHSSIDPAVCFDLGGNLLLLLVGQWMWDSKTYVGPKGEKPPPSGGDEGDDYVNAFPPPWSFPSAEFTLRRLPESGEVLSIVPKGDYVKPEKSKVTLAPTEAGFRESQILRGSLDDLRRVIESISKQAS